ncbi:MAG: flagellar FliJ family protein [Armatimonadetes bacterium]|nr:flagellar FliJ family protein [Armatimonadota bacterium]MCX7969072.1 flagellar FliJ family protein [Armatimonadota bacterium]MDW8142932.1 flagellar FliJ family protein [Armatimonadota bacterium]
MRKFHFPLDGLLKIRKTEEAQAERALQQAQQRLWEAEKELEKAESAVQEAIANLRALLSENTEADRLLVAVRHLDRAEQRRLSAEHQVSIAQAEVSRRLNEYRECRRRRELLEELRQKAWRQWLMEFIREEQKSADERALRDYALSEVNGA